MFKEQANNVNISFQPEKQTYCPGDEVNISVIAKNNKGEVIPAFVGITISDDAVVQMVEKRKQTARLPVMAYPKIQDLVAYDRRFFESEVEHLEDAHVYLDLANPISKTAVDLLLGTQGWRRFVLLPGKESVVSKFGEKGERLNAVHAAKVQQQAISCFVSPDHFPILPFRWLL